MLGGWGLPNSYVVLHDRGRGYRDIHGTRHGKQKKQVRLSLTWALLAQGRQIVLSMEGGGYVMWLGLAVSYFLLYRASELWAYANGQVHPGICLTRNCLNFFHGGAQAAFENRSTATAAQENFWRRRVTRKEQGIPVSYTHLTLPTKA